jgi:pimeloyl-ACP methyl ester carboxylesterase
MRAILLALVLLAACDSLQAAPTPRDPEAPRFNEQGGDGPPEPHEFGDDTYRTGTFTGQGVTRPGLSCDDSSAEARQCSGFLPSAVDGTLLDVSVLVPHGRGPHPLVVLVHGYAGSKSSSGDIARALLDEGFAVLRYSTRGFGRSWGQVNVADVHAEIADLRSIVGQVIDRRGLRLDPDAVAVTGASYGGGHSWLALLEPRFTSPNGTPVRIRTVVPIVPWTDLLYSLLPNGRPRRSIDRPGGLKLSYVNGLYLSGIRESVERPYPNYPDYLVAWHAWFNAVEPTEIDPVFRQIEDGLAGYRSIWWRQDFWQSIAAERVPILQVQGFTDDLFPLPEARRMLLALRAVDASYPIASYFGDLGHPRASNKPGEVDYVFGLIRDWLAYYLKGEGAEPAHVIHAAITRPREESFDPADVLTVPTWDELATSRLSKMFDGTAVLVNPVADPLAGFFWDPLVMEAARELEPYPVPHPPSVVDEQSLGVYHVSVGELSGGEPILIAGQPTILLHASTIVHRVQLNVRLFEVAADETKHLITRGTYTLDSGTPGVPLGEVDVTIPTYGNLWSAPADRVLRLEITNLDSPYITPSRVPSATTISEVRLELPVR